MQQFYPDWTMRLYTTFGSQKKSQNKLQQLLCHWYCHSHKNVLDLCLMDQLPKDLGINPIQLFPMIWRFLPTLDPQVDIIVSRDLDSDIGSRELAAVNEWL